MQSKLCLALAVFVLVVALGVGNPYLATGSSASLRAVPAPQVPAASPVAMPVALRGSVPGHTGVVVDEPPCPSVELRPLVVAVQRGADGQPVWVLQDGRRLRCNPVAGGRPVLVPAPADGDVR